jgi:hypothetical protein
MRNTFVLFLAVGGLFLPVAASADTPSTTRIETRPFYGATVTLEEGVRVFRPLPPHDRVIINPGGRTPLNLTYEEYRSVSHNYNYAEGNAPEGAGAVYPGYGAYGPYKPFRRHERGGALLGGPGRGHGGGHGPGGGFGPGGGGHR